MRGRSPLLCDRQADGVTFGVEEEFLVVDPDTWRVTPRADDVLAAIPEELRGFVHPELHRTQIEISTAVCHDLVELRRWLKLLRGSAVDAADRAGCRLMAAGTGLVGFNGTPPLSAGDRYARMASEFGALVEVEGLCAMHVHVGIKDRDLAVEVSNRLRPNIPVLQSLCANSPFVDGRDTGYSSWRSVLWSRWPTTGPAPLWQSAAHYDETIDSLLRSGAMLDSSMTYWNTRLSSRYPTIEVRVGDVCSTVDETLLVAALVRALVATLIDEVRFGREPHDVDDRLLQAAHWRAAHDGMEGLGFDAVRTELRPAWDLLNDLLTYVSAALRISGDWETVLSLVESARAQGSGAARQRAVYTATADLADVAAFLVDETARGVDSAQPRQAATT